MPGLRETLAGRFVQNEQTSLRRIDYAPFFLIRFLGVPCALYDSILTAFLG